MLERIEIGNRLKRLRGTRPKKEVAEAVHISVSALSMYELGERVPRDEVKVELAKYYGVSVGALFFEHRCH